MKKRIVMIYALLVSGTLAFAQESSKNALEQMGQPVEKAYKAVEKTFVNGYKSVENAFVEPFQDSLSKSVHYRKRYRADIELSYHINDSWFFTTSHGYGFGNGLYIGGGSGLLRCAIVLKPSLTDVSQGSSLKSPIIMKFSSPFAFNSSIC